jgi:hypothetical protein
MQDYEIIGTTKARELLLNDEKVNRFLTYMGLFTKEINNYLIAYGVLARKDHGVQDLFPHKNANALSTKVAGNRYQIKYGLARGDAVVEKRSYPGMCIYYHDDFFGEFSSYPRIIYEVLDSSAMASSVNVLSMAVERGSVSVQDVYTTLNANNVRASGYARRLSNLGFLLFDGKILTPTEISRKILSTKVKEVWKELKEWEHRIDVWI